MYAKNQNIRKRRQFQEYLNTIYNLPYWENSFFVNEIYGKLQGSLLLTGAGTSLDDEIENIKKIKDQIIIIACDRSFKTLYQNNIIPEFVATVDFSPLVEKFFDFKFSPSDTILIYDPRVSNKILNKFQRSMLMDCHNPFFYHFKEKIREHEHIHGWGSITNAMYGLASQLGCKRIGLVGMDFCYYHNTHCKGNGNDYLHPARLLYMKDEFGNICRTTKLFLKYRENMIGLVEKFKIDTYNLTKKGLDICNRLDFLNFPLNIYKQNINELYIEIQKLKKHVLLFPITDFHKIYYYIKSFSDEINEDFMRRIMELIIKRCICG